MPVTCRDCQQLAETHAALEANWRIKEGHLTRERDEARAEVERLRGAFAASNETNEKLYAELDTACEDTKALVEPQAKIAVLRELRKYCQCGGAGRHEEKLAYGDGSPCICPNKICLAIGRELKQLEAGDEQAH